MKVLIVRFILACSVVLTLNSLTFSQARNEWAGFYSEDQLREIASTRVTPVYDLAGASRRFSLFEPKRLPFDLSSLSSDRR